MKSIHWREIGKHRAFCAACLVAFHLIVMPQALAADGDPAVAGKMEALRAMFASPYQEEDYFRTDRLLTTATGSQKPVRLAPSVATVITAADMEAMGARTVDEALESVPGLHVVPSTVSRLDSSYSFRGVLTSRNAQVLLLLDGVPLTYSLSGSRVPTFRMSTTGISRIEVVRGPGSAVHGADAFAGTINMITKDAFEVDGIKAGMRAGSFGTTDTWAQYGGTVGGWHVALACDYLRNDGDTDRIIDTDLQTVLDGIYGTSASLAPGPVESDERIVNGQVNLIKGNWTVRLWGWHNDDAGQRAGLAPVLDAYGTNDVSYLISDVSYHTDRWLTEWDLGIRLNYEKIQGDSYAVLFPAGATLPIGADGNVDFLKPVGKSSFPNGVIGNPGSDEDHYLVELSGLYDGASGHLLRVASGYRTISESVTEAKNFGPGVLDGTQAVVNGTLTDVTGTADIYLDDTRREIWYASLQDEWGFAKSWELTAGVRYDHYSDFGDTVNPRLALVWESRYDLTTKLLYGKAFRAPSFAETGMQNNPLTLGNENLQPETIDSYELAFDYRPLSEVQTVLSLFTYDLNGEIEYVQDQGQTTKTARNYKDVEGRGLEVELDWLATSTLRIRGNFAYQRSKDKATGAVVADTPELQFYANAHWQFMSDWSLDGQYYWIGERHRNAGDPRAEIKDNDVVNVTLCRHKAMNKFDFTVAARNILNEDVREPSQISIANDYPMEGRSYWLEIRTAL